MKKLIYAILLTSFTFAGDPLVDMTKDDNTTIEANKMISELEETPVVIEKKKEEKKIQKSYKLLGQELELDITKVDNSMIDMKTIIAEAIINKTNEILTVAKLKEINVEDYSSKYLSDIESCTKETEKNKLMKEIEILKSKTNAFNNLKASIIKRYEDKVVLKETVISKTPIDEYLTLLDRKFNKYNKFLNQFELSSGKVIIFFLSLIFFTVVAFLLNFMMSIIFAQYSKNHKADDLDNNNFDSIKTPILFLSILIGLQVGIEILVYPSTIPEFLTLSFILINTINILIIFNKLVDISLYILTHKGIIKLKRTEVVNLVTRVIKVIFFTIATIYLLTSFGVNTNKILASLGVGSLALAFASKDLVSKFLNGVKLIMDDTFSTGDWIYFIKTGVQGTVVDVGFFNTTIRTFDNALLIMPNSEIADSSYINWSRRKIGRKIGLTLGVKYSSKREDLENFLVDIREMLATNKKISPPDVDFTKKRVRGGKYVSIGDDIGLKNTLMVHLSEFAESAINIDVYAFSKTVNWAEWREVREEIMFEIMELLKKNNLELAFPSQSLYIEPMGGENAP